MPEINSDVMVFVAIGFGLSIVLLTSYFLGDTIVDKMGEVPQVNSSASTMNTLTKGAESFDKFDYVFFGFFIGFALAIIISGWFIGGHPIFMAIYFFFIVVSVVVAAVLANVWAHFLSTTTFTALTVKFPITNHIMLLLPMYTAIIGIIGLIAMFAKPFSGVK